MTPRAALVAAVGEHRVVGGWSVPSFSVLTPNRPTHQTHVAGLLSNLPPFSRNGVGVGCASHGSVVHGTVSHLLDGLAVEALAVLLVVAKYKVLRVHLLDSVVETTGVLASPLVVARHMMLPSVFWAELWRSQLATSS